MQVAAIPLNESERLADLRALKILDTPPDERFDRVVELASRVFDAPIAYIAMVDSDRQWLKAKCGLTVDETGRDVSFCSHTILLEEPLIVSDATLDPRFADNPLVVNDPFIRFYLGYPLRGPNGFLVGTLCVADRVPRKVDDGQLAMIRNLAHIAEDQLGLVDLIESQRELIQVKAQLASDLAAAGEYVRSLIPAPIEDGPVRVDWRFEPSEAVGGDSLGYHWLDEHRLALYLLDVSGHGVQASLLSCAAQSALRRHTLPDTDFGDPAAVLASLNDTFPMHEHHQKFFTVWYGVYDTRDRTLRYGTAGHPGPLHMPEGEMLPSSGIVIGVLPGATYTASERVMEPGARVVVYSDGAYEIKGESGGLLGIDGLAGVLRESTSLEEAAVALRAYGSGTLEDDLSLLQMRFE